MKFQKSEVREKISAILTLNGATQQMTERTFNSTLDTLMKFASEEVELDAFVSQISESFTTIDGNLRFESSERAKAFDLANPKGKTPEELAAQKVIDDAKAADLLAEPAWAKANRIAQEERFAAMELKLTGAETAKTAEQKRADILNKSKLQFTEQVIRVSERSFDFSKENAETEFNAICAENGTLFGVKPLAGEALPTDFKAQFAAQKQELIKEGVITPVTTN